MKKLILFVGLTMAIVSVSNSSIIANTRAGAPENATTHMIPLPMICTPSMAEMIGALTEDYAVHISMTFEVSPVTGIIVVHNPETGTAAILHISETHTCLVFSGRDLMMFDRPEGMDSTPKKEL